jgi:hypothetical protein
MARRTALITISDPKSRDHGKTFRVTEMAADVAERWAIRCLLAFANAGARLPDGVLESGMAGIQATLPGLLIQGLRSLAGLQYDDAAPLLDDMLGCVDFKTPGQDSYFPLRGSGMTQVEEVSTLLKLRYEVLQVHLNFSLADALSKSSESSPATA